MQRTESVLMKTRPTEITMTPTQLQRWKIEIVIILQIMRLGHKEAEQQTTTRCMKMSYKYTARDQKITELQHFKSPYLRQYFKKQTNPNLIGGNQ